MRNPLYKRIPRELRGDLGKYLAMFLFMILFVSMISGFLITDTSFVRVYDKSFRENKIEDGHFSFTTEAPAEVLAALEEKGGVSIYPYFYFEENLDGTEKNIRVYSTEREMNLVGVLSGALPVAADEIALDRMFAENNNIAVGDRVMLAGRELRVSGYINSPDYSSLFEKSNDMMFDSINFSVAVMTPEGFESMNSVHLTYNYVWQYPEFIEREEKELAKEKSDALIAVAKDVLLAYNAKAFAEGATGLLTLNEYLPRYLNQAIDFVGEDMGGDKILFVTMDYILTVVLAFVFAITISNTITTEAGVIGTLRASGYTKGELLVHYLIPPVLVTFVSALIGNILGYTILSDLFVSLYYGSYSLPAYEQYWNSEAFLLTTVIPILIMLAVNTFVLMRKLKLSPLRFLRRDLSTNKKKHAFRLSEKLPFLGRFRVRIILQNIPNYLTLAFGIFIGGVLVVFGIMFGPLLEKNREMTVNDRICDYQYVLKTPSATANEQAERYYMTSLKTTLDGYLEDEISVFGIEDNSAYVTADIADGRLAVSESIAAKFGLEEGDTFTLKDPYSDTTRYEFTIGSIYDYNAGLAIFMTKRDYCEKFDAKESQFTGYFSDEELTDVEERNVMTVIVVSDLTKFADQMTKSAGDIMGIFKWLGVIVFCLLMYIMSKQIIEKNANSIAMTKILGFTNVEIGGLYIVATSLVVVLSLILCVPLLDVTLRALFDVIVYKKMAGYIPFAVEPVSYVQMVLLGIACYALVAALQLVKISRIPKSNALKIVE